MSEKEYAYYMCDFETTVYDGQERTDVWCAGMCELFTEDCELFGSIDDWFSYCRSLKGNLCCYFHNLKFDGTFILWYLMMDLGFKQSYKVIGGGQVGDIKYQELIEFNKTRNMPNNTFRYSISDRGMWYSITIKVDNRIIEMRDSLKLLPFTVKQIGESFGTKHKKLDMNYDGFRYPNCPRTEKENTYIKNDIYVVKEALEIMFTQGHTKLTIGSCCLEEYKSIIGKQAYAKQFPDVYKIAINEDRYGTDNAGTYIRRSYRGGWCYLVKGKENKMFHNGVTVDVNSLYPSVMHSSSKCRYPVGKPHFWYGNFIPEIALDGTKYYFVRIRTRFYLKEGYLPFIQIKGNLRYKSTENLVTSDVKDPETGEYKRWIRNFKGEREDSSVVLTMTMTDFILFKEHYDTPDLEILDGCWFDSALGIFDEYIDKYKKIKMTSKGSIRQLAKLFLNSLYGKTASSPDSSFKKVYITAEGTLGFEIQYDNSKQAGYIPVGSAITSYARNFTIRAAQKNFYGVDKAGFIYADTDSLHLDIPVEQLKGVPLHDTEFNHWKAESFWDNGLFVRQKTYVEHVTHRDMKPVKEPYYDVKCAGMSQRCKTLFLASVTGKSVQELTNNDPSYDKLRPEEQEFVQQKREITDFKIGLKVPGKLLPKRIKGGTLLVNTTFEMR